VTDRGEALARMARSIQAWQRTLGRAAAGGEVIEAGELVGAIVPAAPSRSILNAAAAPSGARLDGSALAQLASRYGAAGITAFGVWVHEDDAPAAHALTRAGLAVDSRPTAMALDLSELGPDPVTGDELTVRATTDLALLAEPLSAGYGFPAALITGGLPGLLEGAEGWVARVGGVPASAAVIVREGDDAGVFMVATAPSLRGRGAAPALLGEALRSARADGCTSSTLQSSAMARSVYARVGYAELGRYQLWERKADATGRAHLGGEPIQAGR
jgi:GNAT superfamily N-acetyltransferase